MWVRATKRERCKICQHDSWCTVKDDGSLIHCMRVPSDWECKEGGWFHKADDPVKYKPLYIPSKSESLAPAILDCMNREFMRACSVPKMCDLSHSLGINMKALMRMRCGWSEKHQSYSFPMVDKHGQVTGIRLRKLTGEKKSVYGGHEGIFVPTQVPEQLTMLFIAEGPTDTAALLQLGVYAIGRPNRCGGFDLMDTWIRNHPVCPIVIFSDPDEDGWWDSQKLCERLSYRPVKLIRPPLGFKDARAWIKAGITLATLGSLVRATCWHKNKCFALN